MAMLRVSNVKRTVVLVAVCAGSAMLGLALPETRTPTTRGYAGSLVTQSDEKVVEKYECRECPDEPIEFSDLRLKNINIGLREKFSSRALAENGGGEVGDWLENLEFKLKNKSGKAITFIILQLQFPDTRVNGPEMVYTLHIGRHPKASGDELVDDEPLALKPGGTVIFALSAKRLELAKQFLALRNFQLADLNKMMIRIVSVAFDDGTKWVMDSYYKPNPTEPSGYEKINRSTVQ
jgi:hypothetical protein